MSNRAVARRTSDALRSAVLAVMLTLGASTPATPQENIAPADCSDDAILIFDASGSMQRLAYGGETRMSLALQAARAVIPPAAQVRRLGLMIYGPGGTGHCTNFALKVPPTPNAAAPILAEIETTDTAGETPLTATVEHAADVLAHTKRPATIVVITDGDENCGGDPCSIGRRLATDGLATRIHVISFRIGTAPRFRAACLAEETGGLFVPTDTLEELTDALSRVLVCPRLSRIPLRDIGHNRVAIADPQQTAPFGHTQNYHRSTDDGIALQSSEVSNKILARGGRQISIGFARSPSLASMPQDGFLDGARAPIVHQPIDQPLRDVIKTLPEPPERCSSP